MKKNYITSIVILYFLHTLSFAQTLNSYAKVTAIAGNVFSVSNVNETFDTFEDGEEIVIMQMQDDVIGTNTADLTTFGDLSAISSAGLYEVRTILSHTETAGLPATITISVATTNTYHIGTNSAVQIISYRNMGAPSNYTTTANITAVAWDGNIGGVIALYIPGTLTLANNITANAVGFRGGARSADDNTACNSTPYKSGSNIYGYKGEGIYKATDATFTNARAKILSGGGAGSANNGGGGGGGNYTGGGIGGPGWTCLATQGYGYGGIALSSSISSGRIFMGGGGGGGQQNNTVASAGANGGGIILIKATKLTTTGSCGPLNITANGGTAANSGNDGSGGAGAAGSIILSIPTFTISGTCLLTIAANGGTGGTVGDPGAHGGGGAGGQGYIAFSGVKPTTNVTVTTLNGVAGCNNNAAPCTNAAGAATGTDNTGIVAGATIALPIELLKFTATTCDNDVCLDWVTASETNNDYFTIDKTKDGSLFETVGIIDGAGNSSSVLNYSSLDKVPYEGVSYYRLKQTDFNGAYSYSNLEMVNFKVQNLEFNLYPNPNNGNSINISFTEQIGEKVVIVVYDSMGREIYSKVIMALGKEDVAYPIDPSHGLAKGIYMIIATSSKSTFSKKLIVN